MFLRLNKHLSLIHILGQWLHHLPMIKQSKHCSPKSLFLRCWNYLTIKNRSLYLNLAQMVRVFIHFQKKMFLYHLPLLGSLKKQQGLISMAHNNFSSDNVFSPLQYLPSPADERTDTSQPEITLEETRFFTGRSSLGLGSLQEKVQGIPPAFLKPLIKKRVFENDTLRFYAEVFGLPSPEVKWFCNKNELVESSRIKMDRDGDSISLTICNVTKADQGEYICEAINYVGEARSSYGSLHIIN
uniref:Ig-like domain-containing protein n=1 Tax=Periophthalmus magnuspinnatus TaxID=409849 RepID=A0A3B3ZPD8_9GOBI